VILFTEICGEIERVQSVSVGIVFATDVQPLVFAEFAVVGSYIESVLVVGLYGSHGMLLLTVKVHRNLVQIKVLEIEGIPLPIAVVCAIVDQSDHGARGQSTRKQFLVTDIEIILRNCEGLAHHAAYGILCQPRVALAQAMEIKIYQRPPADEALSPPR